MILVQLMMLEYLGAPSNQAGAEAATLGCIDIMNAIRRVINGLRIPRAGLFFESAKRSSVCFINLPSKGL